MPTATTRPDGSSAGSAAGPAVAVAVPAAGTSIPAVPAAALASPWCLHASVVEVRDVSSDFRFGSAAGRDPCVGLAVEAALQHVRVTLPYMELLDGAPGVASPERTALPQLSAPGDRLRFGVSSPERSLVLTLRCCTGLKTVLGQSKVPLTMLAGAGPRRAWCVMYKGTKSSGREKCAEVLLDLELVEEQRQQMLDPD
jgi:hypothetical protein